MTVTSDNTLTTSGNIVCGQRQTKQGLNLAVYRGKWEPYVVASACSASPLLMPMLLSAEPEETMPWVLVGPPGDRQG